MTQTELTIAAVAQAEALEDMVAVCEQHAAFGGHVSPAMKKAVSQARVLLQRYYRKGAFSTFLAEQGGY